MNTETNFDSLFSFADDYRSRFNEQLDRRSSGPVPPSSLISFNVRRIRKETDLLLLGKLSWYLGTTGWLLRENLKEKIPGMQNIENKMRLSLILSSKVAAQEIFLSIFSDRDFYGNQLPRIKFLLKGLEIILIKVRPAKEKLRCRGYRDHGTLRPDCKWLESYDFSLTEKQLEIELQRQEFEDSFEFLKGFLE